MDHLPSNSSLYKTGYAFSLVIIIAWTVSVAGSLIWNVYNERRLTMDVAKNVALAIFNKDLAFRMWATKHGGAYVPPTADTPPNPYLSHIPDRDLQLPSGKKLTLMNPAYMLRQIMEDFNKLYGTKGRITSSKPLNPGNTPDPWERKALQGFERGVAEVTETAIIDGKPYLRLMRPMVVQKGCLKCHAQQGYKEGDIRGGIGVSLPLEALLAGERLVTKNMVLTHGIIWLMGMGGIVFIMGEGKKRIREREKATADIAEREERFRNLVETTSDLVWEVDTNGAYTYISPRIGVLLGYEPGELLGKTPFYLMPPEEAKRVSDIFRTIAALRQPFDAIENTNLARDGSRVVMETCGVPVFDKNGAFQGYRGVDRDITERKKAEKALKESERFLSSIVENLPNMIFVKDARELRFVMFNKAGEELLGYKREDLYGKNDYDFFSREEAEFFTKKDREVLDSKKLVDIPEEPIVTRHQGQRILHTRKIPIVDAEGNSEYLLGISEDITERIRSEEEIKRASKEWLAAMDASEDVIYLLDLGRHVMRANKAFYLMTRSTPETATGKHIVELVHPGGEEVPCPVCVAQEERRDLHVIMEPDHPHNPTGKPIEITLRIVRDDAGQPISMFMTLHDLTHERKVQEELARYREHLEELVKTRTEELEKKNAELEKMNKIFVGRELRMKELKEKIRELEKNHL